MIDFNEIGVTNLGTVPNGMTYAQATEKFKEQRKYFINPYEGGHRLTICDTLRTMWRVLDTMPDSAEKTQLYKYIEQSYDFGKRMDARMKELKKAISDDIS